jgi:hypothetical protein
MMEDLLYCRDLFDPIDVTTCCDDGGIAKPTKPEKKWMKEIG